MRKPFPRSEEPLWISGINPVREALRSGAAGIRELIVCRGDPRGIELVDLGKRRGIPVREGPREELSSLAGHAHHQGAVLCSSEYPYLPLDSLLHRPTEQREPLIVLDCIQDPQNLGALIRSACFLGAKGIVIPQDRSARVTATVIKVSAGAASYLPVVQVTNLARALELMKEAGIWIAGLDVEGAASVYTADLTVPIGLVVGNEQKGLRPLIRRHCDLLLQIPSHGPIQSLNASAAGAVVLAEVQRQREAKPGNTHGPKGMQEG